MINEIFLSICMILPEVCNIKNNIEINPDKFAGNGYEITAKKRGVLKKEYNNEIHYPVIVNLTVFNTGESILTFKLSDIHFYNSDGKIVHIYKNTPAHVLDKEIIVKPRNMLELDIYLISYELNERIKLNGIVRQSGHP